MSRFVPIDAKASSTRFFAPSPIATIAITAATPMTMPSVVRNERILLRRRARAATRSVASRFTAAPPRRRAAAARSRATLALVALARAPSRSTTSARGVLGDVRLVRHEDDGDARAAELLEERHDLDATCACRGCRSARRRGGAAGCVDEGARDRDALLLAAGELVRVVVDPVAEADARERRARARVALAGGDARVDERQLDVLERARAREQVEALEDEAERPVAHRGERVAVEPRHVLAREPVRAARSAGRGSRGCSSASTCPSRTRP